MQEAIHLVDDGAPTRTPLRRTTLSLLIATGVFAGAHASAAAASAHVTVDEPHASGARAERESATGDGDANVVTVSISDADDLSGWGSESERKALLQRLDARKAERTARALRFAAMQRARSTSEDGARTVPAPAASAPIRRDASNALALAMAPSVDLRHPVDETIERASPRSARRHTVSPRPEPEPGPEPAGGFDRDPPGAVGVTGDTRAEGARAADVAHLPSVPNRMAEAVGSADLAGSPPQPRQHADTVAARAADTWTEATERATVRMRARTMDAAPPRPTPAGRAESIQLRQGGASLAAEVGGGVTLADMLAADRGKPAYRVAAGGQPLVANRVTAAALMANAERDGGVGGAMSPEGDMRQIFYDAVQAAIDRSPQLQLAYTTYQAQLADVDEAKGRRWPQLQFGSQSKAVEFGGRRRGGARGTSFTANLTTPVFDWGYLSKTIGSRESTAEAGKKYYEAQLENFAYTVTSTIAECAKQRLLLKVSQQFVDRMQQLVTMLNQIVAVDRGRASELTQAKARLLQAQASRDTVAAKLRDNELSLRKLVGDRPLNLPAGSAWNIGPANLDEMLSDMDRHPQVRQARAEAQAARLQADAVAASARPAVNWVVSKTVGRDEFTRGQPFQTMLTLNWNAFQGGAAKAAQLAALRRAQASERKIAQARLDLEFSIRSADEDARNLLRRSSLYGDLVGETDNVRKAFFDQWYHLGKRTLLDVLQAENDHYGNRVSEISTRFDGYEAVLRERSSAGELVRWLRGNG
ncbi:TolC family protein [Burkholderia cenocepacia]|uniref:TolC family protein n=1 Tax=Burkholderia cenocepacia TaxID=95486 RepID=UPI0026514323|nr:TolC family protein [Burkholderia cenocepacia]MDN7452296.1 TolC family protein [Burkholderia cenocepacia]